MRLLRPADDIQKIYYFTALVDSGMHRTRQEEFLGALSTLADVEIVLGEFLHKSVRCRVSACTATCDRFFKSAEEKRTDVNIAVYMLDEPGLLSVLCRRARHGRIRYAAHGRCVARTLKSPDPVTRRGADGGAGQDVGQIVLPRRDAQTAGADGERQRDA